MKKITKENQVGRKVEVKTMNGTFYGVLIEEHDRHFKGGCVDIGYRGLKVVQDHVGKVIGFKPGRRRQSIPVQNIVKVSLVYKLSSLDNPSV
ncbi:hypothetical protein ACN9ML_18465 [Dyadobacter endophyticus]|uniref:hypothetical protein n=1 Tax=Dyadobacter endophyticus TaxID=1749036 RepID=UPI003CEB7F30